MGLWIRSPLRGCVAPADRSWWSLSSQYRWRREVCHRHFSLNLLFVFYHLLRLYLQKTEMFKKH
jgi:hypothetical protein